MKKPKGDKTWLGEPPAKPTELAPISEAIRKAGEEKRSLATINVGAYDAVYGKPILDIVARPIVGTLQCSTDIPAEALGEITAQVMQRAWRTGIDGKQIKLIVTFS